MRTGRFFEINVTQKGKHVFATDSSIRQYTECQIVEMLKLFEQKFPKEEDYNIDVTFWSCGCPEIPHAISNMLNKKDSNAR